MPPSPSHSAGQIDPSTVAASLLARLPTPGVSIAVLTQLLKLGQQRDLDDGGQLCVEGGPALGLFILMRGQVTVQRRDPDGDERIVATLHAPAMLGHMGVVDRERRSATVVADGPIVVAELDSRTFDRLVGDPSPAGFALRQLVLTSLTRQLATANHRLAPGVPLSDWDPYVLDATLDPDADTDSGYDSDSDSDSDSNIDIDQVHVVTDSAQRRASYDHRSR